MEFQLIILYIFAINLLVILVMSEYIIEFRQVGNLIKVTAADPVTCKEAFITVPAGKGISKRDMTRLAIRRLESLIKNTEQTNT